MADAKNLIAVSWMLPPLVFPRAIQVSRTLKALKERGWNVHVITVTPEAVTGSISDDRFGAIYENSYVRHDIDIRVPNLSTHSLYDQERNWVRLATNAIEDFVGSHPSAALITFAQPWVDHIVGLAACERLPWLPWIAHFSDPWVDSPYIQNNPPPPAQLAHWRAQEAAVATNADSIVFTNSYTADLVMSKYVAVSSKRVFIASHGYDADLLTLISPPKRSDRKLRLVYVGNIYQMRTPDLFLQALAAIHEADGISQDVEVIFVGNARNDVYLTMVQTFGIEAMVHFTGPQGYLDALQAMADADILLVIDAPAESNVFLPSKIVDYLMFNKPILGLTPTRGATADVLQRYGHPIVAPDDAAGVERLLRELILQWKTGKSQTISSRAQTENFDIRQTTITFEQAILAAIARRRRM